MSYLNVKNVEIKGIACAVPKQIKYAKGQPFFTDVEAENFTSVTGVECSRTVSDGMTCSDLCQAAAERLLEESGWEKESVNMLVFVTASRDFFVYPNTANILQDKLGLSDECMAFDLPFACSGYVYGLSAIYSLPCHMAHITTNRGSKDIRCPFIQEFLLKEAPCKSYMSQSINVEYILQLFVLDEFYRFITIR